MSWRTETDHHLTKAGDKKKITILFAIIFSFQIVVGFAQDSSRVITLDEAIASALANGYDNKLLDMNLAVTRAQTSLTTAKDSFGLSGSLGYGQGFVVGDTSLTGGSRSSSGSSASSGAQAGLTLTGPTTSISVTAVPYTPSSIYLPYAGAAPSVQPITTSTLGVNVNQVLLSGYSGGQVQASLDKSLLSLSGKELATQSGRLALILKIKQSYYTMLSAQRTLETRNALLDKQNRVLALVTAIYTIKQATAVDLKTAQINATNATIDADDAMHQLRTARTRLAIMLGLEPGAMFTVADAPDPAVPAASIDDAVAAGLSHRVDLKQLDLQRQSSEIDASVARGDSFFTVSVGGTAAWTFDWSGKNTGTVNLSAKIAMPLIDSGSSQSQQDAAGNQAGVYSLQKEQLVKTITADIRDAYESMQILLRRLETAKMSADNVEAQFELSKVAVENRTATSQDLLVASINAANAEAAYVKAKSDAQLAVLQLQAVMGL